MELRPSLDHAEWDAFVRAHGPRSGAFLQSWAWGEFQHAAGRSVHRMVWEDAGKITAAAQVLVHRLPIAFGRAYVYCPRAPIVAKGWGNEDIFTHLRELGDRFSAAFVRFEPPWPEYPIRKRFVKTIDLQPADTLITDLRVSREQRLAAMHPKSRYNLGLAERKGVQIDLAATVAFDEVWPIFLKTAKRGKFSLHPKAYYQTMLATLATGPCRAFLAVARFEGVIVAANLMIDEGKTRTYLHGASGDKHREVMAPYLLHSALMDDAAQKGMEAYDWWGVAPDGVDKHAWAGVTRFKLGFGGERVSYPGTFDAVLHPARYGLYILARRARRLV